MRIVDNTAQILQEAHRKSSAVLKKIAPEIVATAKRTVVVKSGALRNSITAEVTEKKAVIGSPLHYAAKTEADKPYLRPALEAAKTKLREEFRA